MSSSSIYVFYFLAVVSMGHVVMAEGESGSPIRNVTESAASVFEQVHFHYEWTIHDIPSLAELQIQSPLFTQETSGNSKWLEVYSWETGDLRVHFYHAYHSRNIEGDISIMKSDGTSISKWSFEDAIPLNLKTKANDSKQLYYGWRFTMKTSEFKKLLGSDTTIIIHCHLITPPEFITKLIQQS